MKLDKGQRLKYWGCTVDENDNESNWLFKVLDDKGETQDSITLDQLISNAKIQTAKQIRKWSKGRNVTKDSLRNYINELIKQEGGK